MPGTFRKRARRSRQAVPSVASEFAAADLGDPRLTRRLVEIANDCSERPDWSFPEMMRSEAALEALYRFEGNERVEPQDLLVAHAKETRTRCEEVGKVVVAHDTTDCSFDDAVEREGLGPLGGGKKRGFLLHASIAVAADGHRRPLGVVSGITWVRKERRRKSAAKRTDREKESARWLEGVRLARERLGPRVEAVHVMDREGDAYPLLAAMSEARDHFVVRSAQDRIVLADGERLHLRNAVTRADGQVEVEVALSKRGDGKTPYHREAFPARDRRMALLSFSAMPLVVKRPQNIPVGKLPAEIAVNVVHVWEPNPPEGAEPVEWLLLTSEPIGTAKEIAAVVQYYRTRWVIEEFFKALKTGCALEARQITTYHGLLVVLMIFLPIACRLLFLRGLARTSPGASAELALTKTEIEVLRHFSTRVRVGKAPTVREATLALAGLGGHLKRNGDPGWLTLARGMDQLRLLTAGWTAAREREAAT